MIGKLEDIYAGRGFTQSFHTGNNRDSQQKTLELATTQPHGLIMANFIDFDMLTVTGAMLRVALMPWNKPMPSLENCCRCWMTTPG